MEEGRTWDSVKKVYLLENMYALVVIAIVEKVEKIKKEKKKKIIWGGDCAKYNILEINLQYLATA